MENINWSIRLGALYEILKGEYNTDTDTFKMSKLLAKSEEQHNPSRNTIQSRGEVYWAKQENEKWEDCWTKSVKMGNSEFHGIKAEEILTTKFVQSNVDEKFRE